MDRANTSAARIAEADGLARALYRRARLAGPDFSDIATVVRGLHTVLKHLRVEAEDPDSLLNATQQEHSVYARQLGPIVEDCEFTLKQLDTILEKYGGSSADTPSADGPPRDGYIAGTAESREKDMIALIRTKLANQKTNIDIFLDTVQLHNPATARTFVDNPQSQQLDSIKDKVDAIAARLASRRVATSGQNGPSEMQEEELWQQFCEELTHEGFSSDVLMRNKEVLRAYIREMDSNGLLDNDSPPSVRGLLLDQQQQQPPVQVQQPSPLSRGPPMTVTPASYPHAPEGDLSPKEVVYPANMNEKFLPSVKLDRRPPDYSSAPPPLSHPNRGSPRSPQSPESPSGPPSPSGSGNSPFQAQGQQNQRQHQSLQTYNPYVPHPQPQSQPSPHAQAQHPPPQPQAASPQLLYHPVPYEQQSSGLSALERQSSVSDSTDSGSESSSSNNQLAIISTRDLMQLDHREAERLASQMAAMRLNTNLPPPQYVSPGTSPKSATPRYLPAPPTMADQLGVSPRFAPALPPAYTSPAITGAMVTQTPPPAYGASPPMPATYQQLPRLASRLQPDSSGREIPLDATWTKIRRTLVSPEVLARAGVRYEARPDFVAVLGELTKAEIAQYAHETLEVRRQRMGGSSYSGKRFQPPPNYVRRHSPADDHFRDHRRDEKPRSGSTSDDESVLWDSSDSSSDDERDRRNRSRRADSKSSSTPKVEKEKAETKEKSSQDGSADEEKGTKVYPFILPLSQPDGKNGDAKASPASTVSPKPILKNKNENHVRFDREGPVEVSAEELAAEQRRRERKEKERAEREREREREREQRDRDRRRRDRDRDPDRYRERERSRERERERDHHRRHRYSNSGEPSYRHNRGESSGGASSRDREEARREKKKAWGQTLGAAGIGGAAASLLSVLTEAASGF